MNPLVWAFISLQLSLPLPNIYTLVQPRLDTAYPGYHYPYPPGYPSSAFTRRRAELWTCTDKCRFNNGLRTYRCRYTTPRQLQISCIQWRGILL